MSASVIVDDHISLSRHEGVIYRLEAELGMVHLERVVFSIELPIRLVDESCIASQMRRSGCRRSRRRKSARSYSV